MITGDKWLYGYAMALGSSTQHHQRVVLILIMENKMQLTVKKVNGIDTMSSVDMVKKINESREEGAKELRHDNFLAKVIDVLGEVAALKFKGSYKDRSGKMSSCYYLPKREASLMAMSYSYKLQALVFDKWQEMEAKEYARQYVLVNRAYSRLEFKPMNVALEEARKELGKETAGHHYSNEADMINRIVLGKSSAQFKAHHEMDKEDSVRDMLTNAQISAIVGLQRANMVYIQDGMLFDERKERLHSLYMRKFDAAIVAELYRIEA